MRRVVSRCAPVFAIVLSCTMGCGAAPRPAAPAEAPPSGPHDATSHHSFADVEQWRAVFDDPKRDAWQRPDEVVRALALWPGACVADLGAGTGYFERHLAHGVGPTGTVLAVDTEPNLVTYLRARAEKEGTRNVVPILASPDNPRLPARTVDVILIVDTYHHLDDRLSYLRRLRTALRAGGGRVVVVDWQKWDLPVGPPPDHKLAREQVLDEMQAAGWVLSDERADLLPYQYFLVFRPR
jgi:SAM-dependent methyltransferase